MTDDKWTCPHCGSPSPHYAITVMDDELEVDVTCQSVYITPVSGGDGVAFDHETFERIVEHFEGR